MCAADPGNTIVHLLRFLADEFSRYLGWWRLWQLRWQFGSSISAQGCAADSSHNWSNCWGICCDSGRWIRRELGWCRPWRWQFGSSRSAQGMCSRFKPQLGPLLRFWKMDPLWPGVVQGFWRWQFGSSTISSGVCSRFKPQLGPLLRFWKMDPSWAGVDPDFGGDSSAVRDQLRGVQQIQATTGYAFAAILADGSVVTWGSCIPLAVTVRQFNMNSGLFTVVHNCECPSGWSTWGFT